MKLNSGRELQHLDGCPVLTDPESSSLDCKCWPWLDRQLAELEGAE